MFNLPLATVILSKMGSSSKSVVYIGPASNKSMEQVLFTNVSFLNNQAVPIYISHQDVHATGSIVLKEKCSK